MPRELPALVADRALPASKAAYSRVVRGGDFLFLSALAPIDFATGALVGDEIAPQTRRCIENASEILGAVGATLDDVVSCTVHLADPADYAGFDRIFGEEFSAPYPARDTVGSDLGVMPGMLVELTLTAYSPPQDR